MVKKKKRKQPSEETKEKHKFFKLFFIRFLGFSFKIFFMNFFPPLIFPQHLILLVLFF